MNSIKKAQLFAKKAHYGQCRKISGGSYFTHLENVALLLKKEGFSDEMVAAGYLHDVLEDTDTNKDDLLEMFGEKIVELVLANTEDKTLSWEDRKRQTIEKAKTASLDIKALIAADKLDNIQDMLLHYEQQGDKIWGYFNRGYDKQSWYYRELIEALYSYVSIPPSYFATLKRSIEKVFPQ